MHVVMCCVGFCACVRVCVCVCMCYHYKEASPLDYKKLVGAAGTGSSATEAIDIDSPDFVAQVHASMQYA